MKLIEDVLFGSNELQLVKQIYNKSSIDNVKLDNENEKNIVNRIIKSLRLDANVQSAYLALKAASFGPDDSKNRCLAYLKNAGKEIVSNFSEKVDSVLDMLISKTIDSCTDVFLQNESLYNRNEEEFEYAVRAFDAVLYKQNEFFEYKDRAEISVSKMKVARKFFGDTIIEGEKAKRGNARTVVVPIGQAYLFENKKVSKNGNIIPSGLNGGDVEERTIWNYMEIWSGEDGGDDEEEINRENRRDMKQRAREILNSARNISDRKEELLNIIDKL